ncbi:LacI family DNA-binding transcriptional regulator [Pelagibacterium halotolerans]|uniref:LacI family DNA-binding transcriptional regulator n=1 Tax=Pelagibacterium halotolerans TaxID=531813 RepID=UPI00384D8746
MKDVAEAAGVSPMTVSRAFKRDASVSAETREKILKAADELGYVFDATASNLRSQRTGFVAAIIPSINNANFADTVRALSACLSEHDLQILLGYTDYQIEEEERLISQMLRRRPEAIVLTGGKHTERARDLLSNAGIPVIETWDLPERPIGHVVGFSNAAAMKDMVDRLVADGYRRIGFIGGDDKGDTRGADRRRGVVSALGAHGLDTTRLIAAGAPPISMREGARAMARMLEHYPDTEVVICVSDLSAYGALTECQRRGLRVPDDIAIVGFGNYEISDVSVPTISTIDACSAEIGRVTAELIAELVDGAKPAGKARVIPVHPKLLLRESSARR